MTAMRAFFSRAGSSVSSELRSSRCSCGFSGRWLPAFEGWSIRLAIVIVLLALWAGVNLTLDLRGARRDAALAKGVDGDTT